MKLKLYYFFTAVPVIIFIIIFISFSSKNELNLYRNYVPQSHAHEISGMSGVCNVPKLNPWDPTIFKWIAHPTDLSCKQVQPNLTYIDYDGYLRYNETELKRFNTTEVPVTCIYKTFDRGTTLDDNAVTYSKEMALFEPTKLLEDGVDVKCSYDNKTVFYHNIHAHPAETINRIFAKPTEDQLTMLMVLIDSTAYSVLQRNLPLTYDYTKNVMKMKYLEAYNKIGDNSFPNLIAMLTGKRVYDEQEDMMKEIDYDYHKIKYDNFPLIWKMFAGKGYATVFNEDKPGWGLFHYLAKGFAQKPVDFYYHTFHMALANAYNKNHTNICFGNVPRPQLVLDLTKRHMIVMKDKLQFVYSFSTELTHDYGNEVQRLDEPYFKFFKELHEGNYLNKTAIIFASDHGHRFSAVRGTIVGLLEERMPLYGIWFPSWFYKLHPHIEQNLDANKNVLSSTFDCYETMKDILEANFDGVQRKSTSRGQSQLYPLPVDRNCRSAGIPDHYCTCVKENSLDVKHKAVVDSASVLVESLNTKLKNLTELCYTIKLKQILYATQIDFDSKVKNAVKGWDSLKEYESALKNSSATWIKPKDLIEEIRIGIETEPFDGKFEGLLKLITERKLSYWVLEGDISRINSYSGLSDCIKDKELKKFCSCKSVSLDKKLMNSENETVS